MFMCWITITPSVLKSSRASQVLTACNMLCHFLTLGLGLAWAGAQYVFPFDHNVRNAAAKASGKSLQGGSAVQEHTCSPPNPNLAPLLTLLNVVQEPIHFVHTDYTLTSAPERLRMLARPPKQNDTLRRVLGDTSLIPPELAEVMWGWDSYGSSVFLRLCYGS